MIEVENLSKRYGEKLAVAGLDLAVQPGIVTGFLGPNGAGKSTTMRVIPGLDAADARSVCRQDQPAGRCLPWPGDRTLGTTQPPQARTREAASHWRPPSPPMQNKRKEQEHGPMITTALVAHTAAAAGARKLTPAQLAVDDARCRALFASSLQRSDAPGAGVVAEAIRVTVQQLGTDGCTGRMAQEFGDHPEAAAARMRWVRSLLI
jgi:energy-coupling factor transporter ATP-binding protein EcfA2